MGAHDYEVAVIGGGSAGYATARTTAAAGQRTVVIEAGEELLVCYGAAYERASYTSSCADEARSDEWTRRDYARIRPLITRRP